jgi:hypothetical protein
VASELAKNLAKAKGVYSVTSQLFLNFYKRRNPHKYSEQYLLLQFYFCTPDIVIFRTIIASSVLLCTPDIVYIQNNTCFFSFTFVPQTLFIFRTILSSSVLLLYPRHCLYVQREVKSGRSNYFSDKIEENKNDPKKCRNSSMIWGTQVKLKKKVLF